MQNGSLGEDVLDKICLFYVYKEHNYGSSCDAKAQKANIFKES